MSKKDRDIAETIKDRAGAAFHSVHNALETTENAAMKAVDATAEAVDNMTNDERRD